MNSSTGNKQNPENDSDSEAIKTIADSPASPDPSLSMDRAAALAVLGLKENANAYMIDNRFWQLDRKSVV